MPWWGWLIVAALALVALYYGVALVFFAKTSKRVFRSFDDVRDAHFIADPRDPFEHRHGTALGEKGFFKDDPFDDPFFKDPFGKGQTRKPNSKYL